MKRRLTLACLATAAVLVAQGDGWAHLFGVLSVDQTTRVSIGPDEIRVEYSISLAEALTAEQIRSIDPDGDGLVTVSEKRSFLSPLGGRLADGLVLTVAGRRVPLRLTQARLHLSLGPMGLPTAAPSFVLQARYPRGLLTARTSVTLENRNYGRRAGKRALTVLARPTTALRYRLLADPPARGQPQTRGFEAVYAASADAVAANEAARPTPTVGPPEVASDPTEVEALDAGGTNPMVGTLHHTDPGLWVVLAGLFLAFVLGAAHAVSPGHGKTLVAAYLVGTKGTVHHAVVLGLVVTATHVLSVVVLGVVVLLLSEHVMPETLYPWLGLGSGVLVVGVGAFLLVRRIGALRHEATHHHGHSHGHEHEDGQAPSTSFSEIFWLGVSGGLVPCPSALVVLLIAVSQHRIGLGLALIGTFSLGLAAVLVAIGVLVVKARGLLERRTTLLRWAPRLGVASAVAVVCIGVVMSLVALHQGGIV